MGFYDATPLLGIQQQGNQDALQIGMAQVHQPRPADVFLDRLRQSKQDKLHEDQVRGMLGLNKTYKDAQILKMQQDAQSRAEQADAARRKADTYQEIQPRLAEIKQKLTDSVFLLNNTKDQRIRERLPFEIEKLQAERERLLSAASNLDSEATNRDYLTPLRGNLYDAQAWRATHPTNNVFGGASDGSGMDIKGYDNYMKWVQSVKKAHRDAAIANNDSLDAIQGKVPRMNPDLSDEEAVAKVDALIRAAGSPKDAPPSPAPGQVKSPVLPSPVRRGNVKLKAKLNQPSGYEESTGKPLFKDGNNWVYEDGSPYVPRGNNQ